MNMTLHALYSATEDAAHENVKYHLPERSAYLTDASCVADLIDADELTDILTKTVETEINTALIYTARVREIWEALGEPDPENLEEYCSINHAITAAVVEALICDPVLQDVAREGALKALESWAEDNDISTGDYCQSPWSGAAELLESIREAHETYLIDVSPDLHAMPIHETDTAIITWIAEVLGEYDSVNPAALATTLERLRTEANAAAEEGETLDLGEFNRELERVRCYLDSYEGGQHWELHATIDLDAAEVTP